MDPESGEMLKGVIESRRAGCVESHLSVRSPSLPMLSQSILTQAHHRFISGSASHLPASFNPIHL